MKNNKTFTYVLIAIVGFIWFKVFVRLKDNSTVPETNYMNVSPGFTGKLSKPSDFKIQANYADPFRIKQLKTVTVTDPNSIQQAPKPVKEKPLPKVVYWPPIKYYGFVKNNNSGKIGRALISAEGTIYKVRLNDTFLDGFELKLLSKNQIVLRYKGESKSYYKED